MFRDGWSLRLAYPRDEEERPSLRQLTTFVDDPDDPDDPDDHDDDDD